MQPGYDGSLRDPQAPYRRSLDPGKSDHQTGIAHMVAPVGMPPPQLAAESSLHRSYIGQVERGQRNVTLHNILKLAEVLGVVPGDLVRGLRAPGGGARLERVSRTARTALPARNHHDAPAGRPYCRALSGRRGSRPLAAAPLGRAALRAGLRRVARTRAPTRA